jgi:SAM-dependent methyltransferase
VDGAIGLSVASDIHNKSEVLGLLRARPGARLLDIGCNVGSFSLECSRLVGADEVYGIEIDAGAAEVARAAGVRVTQADCNEPLPYEDGMFDVIVANQVIEHLYFTDDFIEEVRRILRPEGQLVISTTNLAALHYRLWLLAGMQPSGLHPSEHQFGNHLRGVDNPRRGHKSVFTYRAFREFLEYHGFVIMRSLSSGVHPLPDRLARVVCRAAPSLGIYTTIDARCRSTAGERAQSGSGRA